MNRCTKAICHQWVGGRSVRICIHQELLGLNCTQVNGVRYPVLAQVACDYLPVQGSSVPSERAFSSAGLDDDKCHGKTSPEMFRTLQFVKKYYKDLCCQEAASVKTVEKATRAAWTKNLANAHPEYFKDIQNFLS